MDGESGGESWMGSPGEEPQMDGRSPRWIGSPGEEPWMRSPREDPRWMGSPEEEPWMDGESGKARQMDGVSRGGVQGKEPRMGSPEP